MSQDESPEYQPQLLLRKYAIYNNTFAHCLICSTAPINAENKCCDDLPSKKSSHYEKVKDADGKWQEENSSDSWKAKTSLNSSCQIDDIKSVLRNFIREKWGESGKDVLSKISIVMDIHGFNVPLKNCEENYELLLNKFQADVKGKHSKDFVLYINFSWPAEQILKSQWLDWIQAMPIMLWVLIGVSAALFWSNPQSSSPALILAGMVLCLILLRLVIYFRDRDRAANYGVFDAVELVRWIQVILEEIIVEENINNEHLDFFGRANLNFMAHSVGCFVATHTIRVLSDVFDQDAIERWKKISPDGPFGENPKPIESIEKDEKLQKLGTFFKLKTLVIASPDIPIWAITTGRSNFLKSCLRRFKEVYLFTNDADMILRLASTAANYFMFPSNSRVGGYRLGNLTIKQERKYGVLNLGNDALGVRALTHFTSLKDKTFDCKTDVNKSFTIVDCTDCKDILVDSDSSAFPKRILSAFTANNPFMTLLNYIVTAFRHFSGICKVDSHSGYFKGVFCRNLIYSLALYGKRDDQDKCNEKWRQQLIYHQIAWVEASDEQDKCNKGINNHE